MSKIIVDNLTVSDSIIVVLAIVVVIYVEKKKNIFGRPWRK